MIDEYSTSVLYTHWPWLLFRDLMPATLEDLGIEKSVRVPQALGDPYYGQLADIIQSWTEILKVVDPTCGDMHALRRLFGLDPFISIIYLR